MFWVTAEAETVLSGGWPAQQPNFPVFRRQIRVVLELSYVELVMTAEPGALVPKLSQWLADRSSILTRCWITP